MNTDESGQSFYVVSNSELSDKISLVTDLTFLVSVIKG